jgi:hypothetical protein
MGPGTSALRRIDHIVVEAEDEAELFELLTDRLGLPVAWPHARWGPIREGGVGLGNCNLGCNHPLDPASDPSAAVRAIALEPGGSITDSADELDRLGIPHTPPLLTGVIDVPANGQFEPWRQGWSSVLLLEPGLDPVAFLCAYDHDVDARRRDQQRQLDMARGGRLGITALQAVLVPVERERAARAWSSLLESACGPAGLLADGGPDLQIAPDCDATCLVLGVRSRRVAARGLTELGIGYDTTASGELHLDPDALMGLHLRLVEA